MNQPIKVLISGGGTGGHIFPAIAIANAIKDLQPDAQFQFVGAQGRMEMQRVPDAGYPIIGLPVAGFDRHRPWRNIATLLKLWRSMRMSHRIIRDFAPDIAIGVGGYASGPTLRAAQKAGIPTLIQEQNSYAGVTNKLLANNATAICTAYEDMERFFPADRITLTGNPVRASILNSTLTPEQAKAQLGMPADRPLVLVLGGSLGARTINEAMKTAVDDILNAGASLLWQTGKNYFDDCRMACSHITDTNVLNITPFISRMDLAYRAADLIVSRAGASTISEIQLVGAPAILIPSPNVAEDHQRKNAMALTNRGAAEMILDIDAQQQLCPTILRLLADPSQRQSLAANARDMALPDADKKIARKALSIIDRKK